MRPESRQSARALRIGRGDGWWRAAQNCTALHPPAPLTKNEPAMRLLYSSSSSSGISPLCIWPWSWTAAAAPAPKKMVAITRREEDVTAKSEEDKSDLGRPPPFRIGDVRAAIPSHCWVKDPWRSMSYVLRDVVVIAALAVAAGYLDSWIVWLIYWLAQGTMFWAVFVLGHDWYRSTFGRCKIFVMWLDLVTYLHHHGHSEKLPWYRMELSAGRTDHPRQGLWTQAAKPVLGKYYREPEKSGPLPLHLFGILLRSLRVDHFVSDEGDVVYYQSDPQLYGDWQHKSK
ncbi:hypothetical protein BHE74_00042171 [Ensete ventricosum]|uniref:Uncharacterized protein n=1 Tax=Ensete ventricosum TaxID=4639 RepID=A0A427B8G8_ENSVE|nr:hypothetical protein B296_00006201 [Ensete ventricosum]RWW10750.1 hypothetical protein GW17_00025687 [Ensete ventricosum]RWW51474.1 hypothetical protein BHE74_00042171 [Ensete ventricosum]RZR81758.1 hypothetical protein BHM03_00008052 [Ensete ventricosum]